jgi:hypothetical protein
MLIRDPSAVLEELTTKQPVRLDVLPRDHGIYALHDHMGNIRYIGETSGDKYGFYGRINNRHVGGSEGRSHKFSHAYNTGRMWRDKKDRSPDAYVAKELRRLFIRRHCWATYVIVSSASGSQLRALEKAVQAIAPKGMMAWGDKRSFEPLPEPGELVDALLNELPFSPEQRAAIERQAALNAPNKIL